MNGFTFPRIMTRSEQINEELKAAQTVTVCVECDHEVKQVFAGDEGWGVCTGCQQIEGRTKEITEAEYEEIHA